MRRKKVPAFIFLTAILLFCNFCGCARAGNFVGATHGYVTVGMKQKFGSGGEKESCYAIDNMTVIAPGELKRSVKEKIGSPDKVESTVEGYEVWIYKERNIKLFFEKEKFREWVYLK